MVHILKRMRKLQTLFWVKFGPGALVLPKEVSKLGMEFNVKLYGGHRGARKFWHEMLPRLKYRNPSIPMEVNRHNQAEGPSVLHIYTHAQPASTTPAAPSTDTTATTTTTTQAPTYTLDIRNLQESEILEALVKTLPGCEDVQPNAEEKEKMRELEEQAERSEVDRVLMRETLLKERREAAMLKLARGEAVGAGA
ncbi:hypothetical protein J1614_004938, partial [Plenodomus biglobosus]